ncbi:NADPH-dependent FMN reductase [Corynebacterium aquatimens]|nr:NAD(P)H-dependent oxidoreductase [Corynebacterium aquatimens]
MKIGVILGSIRESRSGGAVVEWVMNTIAAAGLSDEECEFVQLDLRDYNLPMDTAAKPPMAANREYDNPDVTRWSKAVDACDGFIFVTPEYNHSVPAVFKNAFDTLGPEWSGKPVGFVGYGSVGAVRAIEHWRQIISNFQMPNVRNQVGFVLAMEFRDGGFQPMPMREGELKTMVGDLKELVVAAAAADGAAHAASAAE